MNTCNECYSNESRFTPLLNPKSYLENNEQYICGTCGRCICIDEDEKRKIQRWNFSFKSLDITKFYLKTADFTMKKPCEIYELVNTKGRKSYKIFSNTEDFKIYLSKNKDKSCKLMNLSIAYTLLYLYYLYLL